MAAVVVVIGVVWRGPSLRSKGATITGVDGDVHVAVSCAAGCRAGKKSNELDEYRYNESVVERRTYPTHGCGVSGFGSIAKFYQFMIGLCGQTEYAAGHLARNSDGD